MVRSYDHLLLACGGEKGIDLWWFVELEMFRLFAFILLLLSLHRSNEFLFPFRSVIVVFIAISI